MTESEDTSSTLLTISVHKLARRMFKIFHNLLEDFYRVFDHFLDIKCYRVIKQRNELVSNVHCLKGSSVWYVKWKHFTKNVNFTKMEHLLLPDMHAYVCVSGGKKC